MPTARNAKGIDVVIYSHDAQRKYTIQIKSLSGLTNVPLGNNLNKLFGDFFIICRNLAGEKPECFILDPEKVKMLAFKGRTTFKSGRNFWLQTKNYVSDEFREKWDKIGKGLDDSTISSKALPPKSINA
jgi:hypothetical protein